MPPRFCFVYFFVDIFFLSAYTGVNPKYRSVKRMKLTLNEAVLGVEITGIRQFTYWSAIHREPVL